MPNASSKLAAQSFFAPIAQPALRCLGRKPICHFLQDRDAYLQKGEEAQGSGRAANIIGANRGLLLSLVEQGAFKGVEEIDDLEEVDLLTHLQGKNASDKRPASAENLAEQVKKSVKIKTWEPGPMLRMEQLIMEHRTFLQTRKMSDVIKKKAKRAINHLASALKPVEIKYVIAKDISWAFFGQRRP